VLAVSSCSVPLQERCRFHDFTPQFTVICSVPGRPQTQVLMFEVVLHCTQPRLSRTTARSSQVLRRVVDASVEGPCVVLIWIRTDDVAEESHTPGRDRLGDRRLSGTDANLLVGDVSAVSGSIIPTLNLRPKNLSSAGKKTARFLLAGACDSYVPYVPYVRCVGWKPRFWESWVLRKGKLKR